MANYGCTRNCYPERYCRIGDIVDDKVASVIPSCFRKLKARTTRQAKNEIEELGLGAEDETPQISANKDLRALPPINGNPKDEEKK